MTVRAGNSTSAGERASSSTSLGLLDRVRQHEEAAWRRLVDWYGPLVYRWCRLWGLEAHDAADIGQQVCLSVFQSVGQFQHGGVKGAFRAWLKSIARRKAADHWRSRAADPVKLASIDVSAEPAPENESALSEEVALLYKRAAELIRVDFSETTWRAFWMAVVDERPVPHIAEELGISRNAVYIAKSRVLTRLRTEFADLLDFRETTR